MQVTLIVGADGVAFAGELARELHDADRLRVVVPTIRDGWVMGMKRSPDLDALLAVHGDPPTHGVADRLKAFGFAPDWFYPDDQEIAQLIVRTELLRAGYDLTDVSAAMATRAGIGFEVVPLSDDRAELHVVVENSGERQAIHIEQYLAGDAGQVIDTVLVNDSWSASANAQDAFASADLIVLGPSSRALSIEPVLTAPGIDIGDTPVLAVQHSETAPAPLVAALPPFALEATAVPPNAAAVVAAARQVLT